MYWRSLWDVTLAWIPFPLVYVLIGYLVYLLFTAVIGILKIRQYGFTQFKKVLLNVTAFTCAVILSFYLFWGFNYKRINVMNELLDGTYVEAHEESLFRELRVVTDSLNQLRSSMGDTLVWEELITGYDNDYRASLTQVFDKLGLTYAGRVRVRKLYPRGSLLYWSTAGVYLPFVNEGHIDPGLHPIAWPFTILHEMSHGYGHTSEDVCNFWALMACINNADRYVRYSGYMSYWRYLRSDAYRQNKERFLAVMECVDSRVIDDLKAMIEYSNRYPDILPLLRDLIYDTYLKSHGVSEGLLSYSRIIVLAQSWQQRYGSLHLEAFPDAE